MEFYIKLHSKIKESKYLTGHSRDTSQTLSNAESSLKLKTVIKIGLSFYTNYDNVFCNINAQKFLDVFL